MADDITKQTVVVLVNIILFKLLYHRGNNVTFCFKVSGSFKYEDGRVRHQEVSHNLFQLVTRYTTLYKYLSTFPPCFATLSN